MPERRQSSADSNVVRPLHPLGKHEKRGYWIILSWAPAVPIEIQPLQSVPTIQDEPATRGSERNE